MCARKYFNCFCDTHTSVAFRDLGVIAFVIGAIRAWILAANDVAVTANHILRQLSLRAQELTAKLPHGATVYGLFLEQGPALQGGHYRWICVMCDLYSLLHSCA